MSVKAHEGFKEKIEESFSRQTAMRLIGAELAAVEPGKVVIRMPYRADLCQQNGFVHAGIISTIADSAGHGFVRSWLDHADLDFLADNTVDGFFGCAQTQPMRSDEVCPDPAYACGQ